jgi:hypothetical protein
MQWSTQEVKAKQYVQVEKREKKTKNPKKNREIVMIQVEMRDRRRSRAEGQ